MNDNCTVHKEKNNMMLFIHL